MSNVPPVGPGGKDIGPIKKEGPPGSDFKKFYVDKVEEVNPDAQKKKKRKEEEDDAVAGNIANSSPLDNTPFLDKDGKKIQSPLDIQSSKSTHSSKTNAPTKAFPSLKDTPEVKGEVVSSSPEEQNIPSSSSTQSSSSKAMPRLDAPPPPSTPPHLQAPPTPSTPAPTPPPAPQDEEVISPPPEISPVLPQEEEFSFDAPVFPDYSQAEEPSIQQNTLPLPQNAPTNPPQESKSPAKAPEPVLEKKAGIEENGLPPLSLTEKEKEALEQQLSGLPFDDNTSLKASGKTAHKGDIEKTLEGVASVDNMPYTPPLPEQGGVPSLAPPERPFLDKDTEALMMQMIGRISYMKEKTLADPREINTTRIDLSNPAFANSKFYNTIVEIKEYSTAKGQFNVEILFDSKEAEQLAEKNVAALIAAFQADQYAKKNMIVNIRLGRKPLNEEIKRIPEVKKDKDRQNE